jgi:hypothetical protein
MSRAGADDAGAAAAPGGRASDATIHGGRPRVFGVAARLIPLSVDGGSLLDQGIDVALLMTPAPDEPFAIRTPRGTLGANRHFVLRCQGLERTRGSLARSTAVSELGMQFDLVTAEIVHARDESGGQDRSTTAAQDPAASPRPMIAPVAVEDAPTLTERAALRATVERHASATAVQLSGIATIASEVSVTLRSAVGVDAPIILVAPRDEIAAGAYFAVRYFDVSGAYRGLLRADTVRAAPGMLDLVEATLIRPPTRAEERGSYRSPFDRESALDVIAPAGTRTVRTRFTDISASGLGFSTSSTVVPGHRVRVADPTLPDLDGAELLVIRRDHRDPRHYGARFVEENRGESTLSSILGLQRSERDHRRSLQTDEIRRGRGTSAAPLTDADIRTLRNRRMATRAHESGAPDDRRAV